MHDLAENLNQKSLYVCIRNSRERMINPFNKKPNLLASKL